MSNTLHQPHTFDGGFSGTVAVTLREPARGKIAPDLVSVESELLGTLLLTREQAGTLVSAVELVLGEQA